MLFDEKGRASMRILHLTNFVGKRSFGVGPVALNLARGQQALGHHVAIWSCDSETEARELEGQNRLQPNTIRTFPIVGPVRLAYSPAMERAIIQHAHEYDVIHEHGIWTAVSRVTHRWRALTDRPTVIAPHGSLDAWALRRSIWKKRLALFFYEGRNLRRVSCLHALSEREAEGFRAYGLQNPIAIIPNGISEEWLDGKGDVCAFRRRFGLPDETRLLFFLGRITPKKGLPMLIRAMSALKSDLENWKLIIAGVNEFGHQPEVETLVKQFSLDTYVQFIGPLYGQDKRDAFAASDLFVLPSHSEGAPVVVLEALGSGVPVLTTQASPWQELASHRCGWWTEISELAIREALREALHTPGEELRQMGQRGKALIAEKYTLTKIAEQTVLLYEWLLRRGDKPEFVIE